MSAAIHQVRNREELKQRIAGPTPTLVDFWAAWCGPCLRVAPALEELATELQGELAIAKVDVDQLPELAAAHRVSGIPTMILFEQGREIDRVVGAASKADLRQWLSARTAPSAQGQAR